jgi:hypothetical protein
MKIKIENYQFDKTAKTITFLDYPVIRLDSVLLVTNVTDNIIIYLFSDPLKGGSVDNNILTLTYDTSGMDSSDKLQIFYDDVAAIQKVAEQNPINISGLSDQSIKDADVFKEFIESIHKEENTGELNTIDENLRMVLGTERLTTNTKKLNVNPIPDYYIISKNLAPVTNSVSMIDVLGYSSLAIQLTGVWAGTVTFECSGNAGEFIALNGIAVNGTAIISSATTNGIYRFNIASLSKIQVRFSTATSGSPIALFIASSEPSTLIVNAVTITGTVPISGAVTTTDSILPSSITSQANPAKIIPVAPTFPASGINNFLSSYFPQIFQRLRVESAGSNRTPFKQEDNTDRLTVGNDEDRLLLQNILRQLEIANNFKYQELDRNGHPNLKIPEGFNEY